MVLFEVITSLTVHFDRSSRPQTLSKNSSRSLQLLRCPEGAVVRSCHRAIGARRGASMAQHAAAAPAAPTTKLPAAAGEHVPTPAARKALFGTAKEQVRRAMRQPAMRRLRPCRPKSCGSWVAWWCPGVVGAARTTGHQPKLFAGG